MQSLEQETYTTSDEQAAGNFHSDGSVSIFYIAHNCIIVN